MKGLLGDLKKLHFTTVLSVRRARSDERVASATHKICISPSFLSVRRARSDEGCFPIGSAKPILRKFFFLIKAAFWKSSLSVSSSSPQPFSAAFSAALPSSFFQQPVSAAFLSSASQQFFQHPFPASFLSSLAQQPFSAAILSYHLAVVRGWWSAINIILLL